MVNYSKWDGLDADSDDEGPGEGPAAEAARLMLNAWIQEAAPELPPAACDSLVDFISVTLSRTGHGDNLPRAAEIIQWLEDHPRPSSDVLLRTLWHCRRKDEAETDPAVKSRIMKLRVSLLGGLNTLEAIAAHGGALGGLDLQAAKLFDALRADETLRRRYGLHAFANERYGQHCRAVLSATMAQPSELELPRWVRVWQRVRRGTTVVLSVVVAVLSVLWARLLLF